MANWTNQYPLVREVATARLKEQGVNPSIAALATLLGVSRGQVQAWERGQRPSADALETMAKLLGLSPEWLLTGEGRPEASSAGEDAKGPVRSAMNAKGRLIGDMLWDIFGLLGLELPDVAKATGIRLSRLQNIMASEVKPNFDELTKLHTCLHLDVHTLLTGEGEAFSPHDEFTRIAQATGTDLRDDHGLARVFGCPVDELRAWKSTWGTAKANVFPPAWLDAALELYGINPAWAVRGIGKSHLSRDEVRQQIGAARGYSTARESSGGLRAAEDAAGYTDPSKAAGDDSV